MDGERQLLFINPKGEFYFINRMNTIKKIGMKMPDIANSLLDGEYLEGQELYMVFDAYFYQGKPTWKEVFDPRYEVIKQVISQIEKELEDWDNRENVPFRNRPMFSPIYTHEDLLEYKKKLEEYDMSFAPPVPYSK
jgi:hypothetical protein